jgi:hypothetical protein
MPDISINCPTLKSSHLAECNWRPSCPRKGSLNRAEDKPERKQNKVLIKFKKKFLIEILTEKRSFLQ